jgi:predicted 2-oxoglutarate/Fe(II)-dependent dioxygenase YbiX
MDDAELREIKRAARRNRMTVAEWVRQALRAARRRETIIPTDRKLQVVREAARHDYPTGDIEEMLGDIERGYAQDAQ